MGLSWWHHQRKHQSSASLAICAGNSPVTGEFPAHRPVTRSFEVFFDLCLNKRLSKQSWGWWFETPSHPLWRYCNGNRSFATVHWHGTGCTGSCRNLWCRQWWKCPQMTTFRFNVWAIKYTQRFVLFCFAVVIFIGDPRVGNPCGLLTYILQCMMTSWASYQIRKIAGCACAGNAGNVFPRRRFQMKPLVSDPGMHHGTCVTHVPWCMSGSLTCGDGENVPGIPGACAPTILHIWQEAHDMNTFSALLVLYERYPLVTDEFLSQRASCA